MAAVTRDSRELQIRDIAYVSRQRYGDRIEDARREGRSWKTAFWAAFALLAAALGALVYVALQPRFVPYVVAVDQHGVALPIGPAARAGRTNPDGVRAELTRFITSARTVSSDRYAQAEMVERAYAYATPATANVLNAYFRQPGNDARLIAQRAVRLVRVLRVTPLPPPRKDTWNVLWEETEIEHGSEARSTTSWEAFLTVRQAAPARGEDRRTEKQISQNPLGIYVTDLTWSPIAAPGPDATR